MSYRYLRNSDDYTIRKEYHTRRKKDYYLVVPTERLGDDFQDFKASAMAAGGEYQQKWGKVPGGFAFDTRQEAADWAAEAFGETGGAESAAEAPPAVRPLYGHTTEATAYKQTVGGKTRAYWLEYKKGKGYRIASRTVAPRLTQPKRSTYAIVGALFLNENGEVGHWVPNDYEPSSYMEFLELFPDLDKRTLARVHDWAMHSQRPGVGVAEKREAWKKVQTKAKSMWENASGAAEPEKKPEKATDTTKMTAEEYTAAISKAIKKNKKALGVKSVSQGYKGTGSRAADRLIAFRSLDGKIVQLSLTGGGWGFTNVYRTDLSNVSQRRGTFTRDLKTDANQIRRALAQWTGVLPPDAPEAPTPAEDVKAPVVPSPTPAPPADTTRTTQVVLGVEVRKLLPHFEVYATLTPTTTGGSASIKMARFSYRDKAEANATEAAAERYAEDLENRQMIALLDGAPAQLEGWISTFCDAGSKILVGDLKGSVLACSGANIETIKGWAQREVKDDAGRTLTAAQALALYEGGGDIASWLEGQETAPAAPAAPAAAPYPFEVGDLIETKDKSGTGADQILRVTKKGVLDNGRRYFNAGPAYPTLFPAIWENIPTYGSMRIDEDGGLSGDWDDYKLWTPSEAQKNTEKAAKALTALREAGVESITLKALERDYGVRSSGEVINSLSNTYPLAYEEIEGSPVWTIFTTPNQKNLRKIWSEHPYLEAPVAVQRVTQDMVSRIKRGTPVAFASVGDQNEDTKTKFFPEDFRYAVVKQSDPVSIQLEPTLLGKKGQVLDRVKEAATAQYSKKPTGYRKKGPAKRQDGKGLHLYVQTSSLQAPKAPTPAAPAAPARRKSKPVQAAEALGRAIVWYVTEHQPKRGPRGVLIIGPFKRAWQKFKVGRMSDPKPLAGVSQVDFDAMRTMADASGGPGISATYAGVKIPLKLRNEMIEALRAQGLTVNVSLDDNGRYEAMEIINPYSPYALLEAVKVRLSKHPNADVLVPRLLDATEGRAYIEEAERLLAPETSNPRYTRRWW